MLPNPNQLFEQFEKGEIEREELQAMMACHARELIREMEDDHQNPAAALLEQLLARRLASRLVKRHGPALVREVLQALGEFPDFAPARHLWNSSHLDVPLHCFFRMRREPVFRIKEMETIEGTVHVLVEHGAAGKGRASVRTFVISRNGQSRLQVIA